MGFIEIFEPKKRQKSAFFCGNFQKNSTRGEKTSATKMINSVSSIYDKNFRLLSFAIEELAKDQVGQENPHWAPPLAPFARLKFFLSLRLCLQLQVLQTVKVSFHSVKVDVMVVRFLKNHPPSNSTIENCPSSMHQKIYFSS